MPPLNLTNQFLIAMPSMGDPNFAKTVTYVCIHNNDGAMGIVINRPLEIDVAEVLAEMKIESINPATPQPVYQGGPVQKDCGFIIHNPARDWNSTIQVTSEIAVSTSRDILEAMGEGAGPTATLVALGYAGWNAGQLEEEMKQNAWLNSPADMQIIFDTPPQLRWQCAVAAMGVDLSSLSYDVGHA